jgi:hypothetical protein
MSDKTEGEKAKPDSFLKSHGLDIAGLIQSTLDTAAGKSLEEFSEHLPKIPPAFAKWLKVPGLAFSTAVTAIGDIKDGKRGAGEIIAHTVANVGASLAATTGISIFSGAVEEKAKERIEEKAAAKLGAKAVTTVATEGVEKAAVTVATDGIERVAATVVTKGGEKALAAAATEGVGKVAERFALRLAIKTAARVVGGAALAGAAEAVSFTALTPFVPFIFGAGEIIAGFLVGKAVDAIFDEIDELAAGKAVPPNAEQGSADPPIDGPGDNPATPVVGFGPVFKPSAALPDVGLDADQTSIPNLDLPKPPDTIDTPSTAFARTFDQSARLSRSLRLDRPDRISGFAPPKLPDLGGASAGPPLATPPEPVLPLGWQGASPVAPSGGQGWEAPGDRRFGGAGDGLGTVLDGFRRDMRDLVDRPILINLDGRQMAAVVSDHLDRGVGGPRTAARAFDSSAGYTPAGGYTLTN